MGKGKKRAVKGSYKWYFKRVDDLFKQIIRSKGYCEKCQRRNVVLHCSHIKSVGAYKNLQFELKNAIALCHRCHMYWWHKEPTESGKWFEKRFPERAKYLEREKNIPRKYDTAKLAELYVQFSKMLEKINA
jgi:hypothetical protein